MIKVTARAGVVGKKENVTRLEARYGDVKMAFEFPGRHKISPKLREHMLDGIWQVIFENWCNDDDLPWLNVLPVVDGTDDRQGA